MNLNGFAEGRWLSPDPAGGDVTNPQSLNRYAYVMNNPTTFVDPLGLETINYGSTGPPPCETQSGPLSPMTSCYTQFGIQAGTLPAPPQPDEFDLLFPQHVNSEGNLITVLDPNGQAVLNTFQNQTDNFCWWCTFAANNGLTISAAPPLPWYKNSCTTSALGAGALSAGIDAIGLIPEAGGIARMIGHGSGYVGVVADQAGNSVVEAVGASTGTVRGLNGLFDTSPQGLISDGLTVAGFVPGLGQVAAGLSVFHDVYLTARAIGQCH
jgi:hypothetical protein